MNQESWQMKTDDATAARRAAGRRHYNSWRQRLAEVRRGKVVELMASVQLHKRGWKSAIARELGVHRSTVCRDLEYFDLLERGYSPYEIYLRRKAERGQEITDRPDTSPDVQRYDHHSVVMRELAAMGFDQSSIDMMMNHHLR